MATKASGTETVSSFAADGAQETVLDEKQQASSGASYPPGADSGRRVSRRRINQTGDIISLDNSSKHGLTWFGRIYDRLLGSNIIIRYVIWMLPVSALLSIPLILGFTKYHQAELGGVRLGWIAIWAEIVWNSLWISKLAAKGFPHFLQYLCGWVNPTSRKWYRAIGACELPLSFIGWALISWATFVPVMTRNPHARQTGTDLRSWEEVINQLLAGALVASCVWFIETLMIQLIAINYHRKAFSDKITLSKQQTKLLSIMYEASTRLYPRYCEEYAEEDYLISGSITATAPVGSRPGAAKIPIKVVREFGRVGDAVGNLFSRIAKEAAGKKTSRISEAYPIVVEALERTKSSEALARRLFGTFSQDDAEMLTLGDFVAIIGRDKADDAALCFKMLDKDVNDNISESELIAGVVEIGHGMRSLSWSVRDVQECVRKLDDILLVAVIFLSIYILITFVSSSKTTTLVTNASTFALGLSWLFGSTGAEFLQSCIFIFAKHPYDVGDRVDIGKESFIVEHIDLLYTTFKRLNNSKNTQVANSTLSGLWIDNVSRSQSMRDSVNLFIHFETSMQDINLLRNEMTKFVQDPENSRDYMPDIYIEVTGVAEMNKLELRVSFDHKSNWSNETLRSIRRTKFLCGLVKIIRTIPIYGPGGGSASSGDPSNPSYSVSISSEDAAKNQEKFTANKLAKRMVPVAVPEEKIFDSRNETSAQPETPGGDRIMTMP